MRVIILLCSSMIIAWQKRIGQILKGMFVEEIEWARKAVIYFEQLEYKVKIHIITSGACLTGSKIEIVAPQEAHYQQIESL